MSRGSSATKQESVQEAKKRLQKFLRQQQTVPTEVLQEERATLYAEIIKEVPYSTGALERSVRVSVARDRRRPGLNASASARSPQGYNYAGIQHENDTFVHSKPGAKDHYISDPFKRATERIIRKISDRMVMEAKDG